MRHEAGRHGRRVRRSARVLPALPARGGGDASSSTSASAAASAGRSTPGRTRSASRPRSREAGIEYRHHRELAPTTELRELQYAEDDRLGVGKRSRVELAPAYRERYVTEILDAVDLEPIVAAMPEDGRAALLCVERDPEACHRSLIAARLEQEHGVEIVHLRPTEK